MKKLLLIFAFVALSSCTNNYNEVKYEPSTEGIIISIDSAQWTPVLMKEIENDHILIFDNKGIKKISISDGSSTALGILIWTFILALICIFISKIE